jgi:NAD(P)-dependent dehydrogenase (short-subunit alcohol dehydrogenase family)
VRLGQHRDADARGDWARMGAIGWTSVAGTTFDFSNQVVVVVGGTGPVGVALVEALIDAGAHVVEAEVEQPDQATAVMTEALEWLGRLDVLVNVVEDRAPGAAMAEVVAGDVLVPFYCAQAAHRVMAEQAEGGVIVNVATSSAAASTEGAVHGAGVVALGSLSSSLAAEWSPLVRVNFVSAGQAESEVGDVVAACLFLARAEAAPLTGAQLVLQGGLAPAQ